MSLNIIITAFPITFPTTSTEEAESGNLRHWNEGQNYTATSYITEMQVTI